MLLLWLLGLCCTGDVAEPAAKVLPASHLPQCFEDITIDATRTNARGLQIISMRVKVHPKCAIGFGNMQAALRLAITTRDPKTQIHVIYPSGPMDWSLKYYRDEIAIQVLIQRAEGDQSPVQGRLDIGRFAVRWEKRVVIGDGSERTVWCLF
jgi:hypothetical protein